MAKKWFTFRVVTTREIEGFAETAGEAFKDAQNELHSDEVIESSRLIETYDAFESATATKVPEDKQVNWDPEYRG